jgi:hypothetical protein
MIGKGGRGSKAIVVGSNDRSVGNKTFTAEDAEEDAENAEELGYCTAVVFFAAEFPRLGVFPRNIHRVIEVKE